MVHTQENQIPDGATHDITVECAGRAGFLQIEQTLSALEMLETGWNTYSAPPPNGPAIDNVRAFLKALRDEAFVPSRVAASAVGGVGVTFRSGSKRAYVEFNNDGTIHALIADVPAEPALHPVGADPLSFQALIEEIRDFFKNGDSR